MITTLKPNEVFVYGANRLGIHGAGAAKQAMQWGAVYGQTGRMGQTYGIITKETPWVFATLETVRDEVRKFLEHARNSSDTFLVTEVGCGLAGFTVEQIAPLFLNAPANVILPNSFKAL